MDCPACGKSMIEESFGDVQVDVCKSGCKGIWFDWGELKELDESHEGVGKAIEEALSSIQSYMELVLCEWILWGYLRL